MSEHMGEYYTNVVIIGIWTHFCQCWTEGVDKNHAKNEWKP